MPFNFRQAKEIELGGSAVSIEVPSIGGSEPRTIKVLLDPPKSAPRVELSAGNLEWLARVIKIERAANTRKRPAEEMTEEQTSARGMSFKTKKFFKKTRKRFFWDSFDVFDEADMRRPSFF